MRRPVIATIVLGLALATAACSSPSGDASPDGPAAVAGSTDAPNSGIAVAAAAPGQADAAACDLERRTLELASEAFEALNGMPPTSQDELLEQQLIREASPRYEFGPDGSVIAAAGSPCR